MSQLQYTTNIFTREGLFVIFWSIFAFSTVSAHLPTFFRHLLYILNFLSRLIEEKKWSNGQKRSNHVCIHLISVKNYEISVIKRSSGPFLTLKNGQNDHFFGLLDIFVFLKNLKNPKKVVKSPFCKKKSGRRFGDFRPRIDPNPILD